PSTAAITGLGQSMIARQYFCTLRDMTSTGPASAISPMSAPAAKATSDPVTMTQRTLLSTPQRVISSASRARTSRLSALRTCGRLILKTTMSSFGCSTRREFVAAMKSVQSNWASVQETDAGLFGAQVYDGKGVDDTVPDFVARPGNAMGGPDEIAAHLRRSEFRFRRQQQCRNPADMGRGN